MRIPDEGRSVEEEFARSWDWIERYFRDQVRSWPFAGAMVSLIAEMRRDGYDRRLRVGQSLYALILSRSRLHGLREDQPFMVIEIDEAGVTVHASHGAKREFFFAELTMTPELAALLRRLEAAEVS